MAEKRKRGQNFTYDEKDKLVKLLGNYKNVILNKKTDGTTNNAKNEAWVNLCSRFNSTGNAYRSKESLVRVWEKMKTEAKLYRSSNRSCSTGTGGGPSTIKTDPIMEQVSEFMGRGCSGIADVDDSDADLHAVYTHPVPAVADGGELMEIILDVENSQYESTSEVLSSAINNAQDETPVVEVENDITSTPIWKRRRPTLKENEKSEVMSSLCTGFKNINSKTLLVEELEFKRNLYTLQLEAARKDIEIKNAVLNQIKGGTFDMKNLFRMPTDEDKNTVK